VVDGRGEPGRGGRAIASEAKLVLGRGGLRAWAHTNRRASFGCRRAKYLSSAGEARRQSPTRLENHQFALQRRMIRNKLEIVFSSGPRRPMVGREFHGPVLSIGLGVCCIHLVVRFWFSSRRYKPAQFARSRIRCSGAERRGRGSEREGRGEREGGGREGGEEGGGWGKKGGIKRGGRGMGRRGKEERGEGERGRGGGNRERGRKSSGGGGGPREVEGGEEVGREGKEGGEGRGV